MKNEDTCISNIYLKPCIKNILITTYPPHLILTPTFNFSSLHRMDHTDWKLNRFGLNGMSTTAATFAARIWNETSTEHAEYSTNTGEDDVDEINR